MKRIFFILIFIFIISGVASAGVLTVTSPAAGSSWCIDQQANPVLITWNEIPKDHQNVKIRLFDSTLANQILKITDNTPNDGSYNWVIPANIPPGQYRIRVKSTDDQASGNSAIFSISDCLPPDGSISVTKPVNSDVFSPGGNCPVNWNSQGTIGTSVKIRLFNSAGTSFIQNIVNNTNNDGNYNWNIPNSIQTGYYRIKVQNITETVTGTSDMFSISDTPPEATGTMTITSPKQGDHLIAGGSFDIEWKADGYVPNKCVDLFLFKGNTQVMQITQNRCVNGFHWNIPANLSGTNYKIRLRTTDGQLHDDSVYFSIIGSRPDLVIGGKMTRTPKHPKVGEFFDFKFRVDNAGNGQAAGSSAELTIKGPENFLLVKRISVRSLGGAPDHAYFKKTIKLPRIGIYRFTLKLDVDNNVQEGDESNNEKWILVDINPKQFPDLKIVSIYSPDYKKTIHQECKMEVTVKNIGPVDAGRFEIDCDWKTCTGISQGRKYKVCAQGLKSGESITFTFKHKYWCLGMKYPSLHVDKANQVQEKNENNNKCGFVFHLSGENIVGKDKSRLSYCNNN